MLKVAEINDWPLGHIKIVLVRPRFPENIGMIARAAANMGCPNLVLIEPEIWNEEKAAVLATSKGMPVLKSIEFASSLDAALAGCNLAIGTTARLGGWRADTLTPWQAAEMLMAENAGIGALVFGSEDKGLTNEDICSCTAIAHISTAFASSLNLAQAALIMLYECHKLARDSHSVRNSQGMISIGEEKRLLMKLKEALLELDCLHGQNPDYFFRQWQGLFRRMRIKRHEYDAFMGFLRQLNHRLEKGRK